MEMTLEQRIADIIEQIRPHLQADGGDIRFVEVTEDYVVKVELQGACGSCPYSKITLKKYIPEVKEVVDINLDF